MSKKRFSFNPEINTGHIMQMLVMLTMGIGVLIGFSVDRARFTERLQRNDERLLEVIKKQGNQDDSINRLVVAHERILTLLEERTKRSN